MNLILNKFKNMKPISLFFTILVLTVLTSCGNKNSNLKSPSRALEVKFHNSTEGLNLELLNKDATLLNIDLGKFVFEDGLLGESYQIKSINKSSTDKTWKPVYGERSSVRNNYNETEISLKDGGSEKTIRLICRLYDEGVAFRYLFDERSVENTVLNRELTSFNFAHAYDSWVSNQAQGAYSKKNISDINSACERPLVIQQNDSSYLAIGEANLVDFARMKLISNKQKDNSLQVELSSNVDIEAAGFLTPWRYVMVADSPGKLMENNYFIENLNEPNKIEDTSWIKPGKVIREVTLTTQGGMACVDFAARHNIEYVEFDAGWYGPENDKASDATTITVDPARSTGTLELQRIIDYANNKGVGVVVYVNHLALENQLDEILPLYKSWGIKGIKYGFVNVGSQEWTSWLHDAIRKAAKYELMVDVHDEYRPTGYSRTYPNLMTQEGIRGDEESPSIEQTLITAFTRMIAGAGDQTNCFQADRVSEKMGGKAGQMAKSIILYSPWQFLYWYDRPTGSPAKIGGAGKAEGFIVENEELDFYDSLPVVWDETNVIEGKIGEYATFVRKSCDMWFIGSLVAKKGKTVEIPLTFLTENENYEATVFYQNAEGLNNNVVSQKKIVVNNQSTLKQELLANSGFAVIVKKSK